MKIENNMKNEFISTGGNYAIVGDKVEVENQVLYH